jgi:hypothetical protein
LLEGEQLEQQVIVNELLSGGMYVDPRKVVGVTEEGVKVLDEGYCKQILRRHSHGVNVLRGEKALPHMLSSLDRKAKTLIEAAEQGSSEAVQKLLQEGVPVGGC